MPYTSNSIIKQKAAYRLRMQVAESGIILTDAQVAALERKKHDVARAEIETYSQINEAPKVIFTSTLNQQL